MTEEEQKPSTEQPPTIIVTFGGNWIVDVRFAEPEKINVNHILTAGRQLTLMGEFMLQSQMAMEQQRRLIII